METQRITSRESTPTPPRWVPKPPPPPGPWDHFRMFLRRSVFPITVLVFLAALVLFLLRLPGFGVPGMGGDVASEEQAATPEQQQSAGDEAGPAPPAGETIPLTVESEPSGATVLIDGEPIGTTPVRDVSMARGAYILSVHTDSHRMPDTLVVLRSGAPSSFSFRLRPAEIPEDEAVAEAQPEEPAAESVEEEAAEEPAPEPQQPVEEETSPAEPPPAATSPQVTETPADEELAEEEEWVELAEEDFALGHITVSSEPSGATVLLNGIRRGTTPLQLNDLQVGEKEIRVQLDGHATHIEEVDVEPDEIHEVFATLSPLQGQLRVLARPWGSIYVNDSLHESETNVRYTTELPVGTHTVRVEHPTLGTQERQVTIREGEVTSITIDLNQ